MNNKIVSNLFYVNNTFALSNRILGQVDRNEVAKDLKRGFWRMPKFSNKEVIAGIIEIDGFINTRLLKFKNSKDEDENPDDENKKIDQSVEDIKEIHIEERIDKELTKLSKNIQLLEKNKRLDEINTARRTAGLDIINCFVLAHLQQSDL